MVLLYKTAYDIIISYRFFFFTILGNVNTIYIYIYEMIMAEWLENWYSIKELLALNQLI